MGVSRPVHRLNCSQEEGDWKMKTIAIATVAIAALMLALASGITHAQTPLDNLCKSTGDSAREAAQARDRGTRIEKLLEDIDEAWETNHELSPENKADAIRQEKEEVRKVYAHPEVSPTQEWHIAVKACYAAHGVND
jgi:hypothetical protein